MNTFFRLTSVVVVIIALGGVVYVTGNKLTTGAYLPVNKNTLEVAKVQQKKPIKLIPIKTAEPKQFVVDLKRGKKISGKCKACHTFGKGEKNATGPNLWGIVNRMTASKEDFNYSAAFKAKGESGLQWTEENLNVYLKKPRNFIPGNKMAFGGIRKESDRLNLIAWLKTLK